MQWPLATTTITIINDQMIARQIDWMID